MNENTMNNELFENCLYIERVSEEYDKTIYEIKSNMYLEVEYTINYIDNRHYDLEFNREDMHSIFLGRYNNIQDVLEDIKEYDNLYQEDSDYPEEDYLECMLGYSRII